MLKNWKYNTYNTNNKKSNFVENQNNIVIMSVERSLQHSQILKIYSLGLFLGSKELFEWNRLCSKLIYFKTRFWTNRFKFHSVFLPDFIFKAKSFNQDLSALPWWIDKRMNMRTNQSNIPQKVHYATKELKSE